MTLRTIKRTATALILSSMLALVIACAGEAETIIVEKEVVKTVEVPVEKIVEKEVVKTVEVAGETVIVEKEVVKVVEKEVPVEVIVEKEVV